MNGVLFAGGMNRAFLCVFSKVVMNLCLQGAFATGSGDCVA